MISKKRNDYMTMFEGKVYERTPKSVFAAVCASLLSTGGERREDAQPGFLEEWRILHEQGIVPQKPCISKQGETK